MATSHAAIKGSTESLRQVTRALISVSDKTGIVALATFLAKHNVELLSTGGTAAQLRQAGLQVKDVAEHTGMPEMLDGRVKTLHPKVHGGLLAVRGNAQHDADCAAHGIAPIDLVVLNLYPFEQTVAKGADFETCVENVDIGGPAMLRASAKNHAGVAIVTDPAQYAALMDEMQATQGKTSLELRRRFAHAAFALTAKYDASIAAYFASQLDKPALAASTQLVPVTTRTYAPALELKYGCNPHQAPAALCTVEGAKLPFTVLNGKPGYINLLDAANAWQLVLELKQGLGLAAAASFKHVSPAGAGVAVPLTPAELEAYELECQPSTPAALAYARARNADPMSSFGDFAAISEVVDEATALYLKTEVSDGIVAAGYHPAALEILKQKKGGAFIVLQADASFAPPAVEYREVFGMGFMQRRNDRVLTMADLSNVVTAKGGELSDAAKRDMLLASIALKYTQSNSVSYAMGGQVIGVGAGQQSRVDCVKLAGRKVAVWYLRQHPKVRALKFKPSVKRQERVNARVRYIEGDMGDIEFAQWKTLFDVVPEALSESDKLEFLRSLKGVSLSSDAFFPFRDSIDHASKLGVSFVVQPGGSNKDQEVTEACEAYGMTMCFTGVRLFFH